MSDFNFEPYWIDLRSFGAYFSLDLFISRLLRLQNLWSEALLERNDDCATWSAHTVLTEVAQ